MAGKRIILVDDDPGIVELFKDVLESRGYQVQTFQRGWEALQAVSRERPDLIILDIMLPRVNGYEVCQIIKENPGTKHIPVIFLSALSHQDALRMAADGGADDYLVKPCTAERLLRHVERQLKDKGEAPA